MARLSLEWINRLLGAPKLGTPERARLESANRPLEPGEWRVPVLVLVLAVAGCALFYRHMADPRYQRPKVAPHRPIYEGREEMVTPAEQDDAGDWDGCTGGVHPTC